MLGKKETPPGWGWWPVCCALIACCSAVAAAVGFIFHKTKASWSFLKLLRTFSPRTALCFSKAVPGWVMCRAEWLAALTWKAATNTQHESLQATPCNSGCALLPYETPKAATVALQSTCSVCSKRSFACFQRCGGRFACPEAAA